MAEEVDSLASRARGGPEDREAEADVAGPGSASATRLSDPPDLPDLADGGFAPEPIYEAPLDDPVDQPDDARGPAPAPPLRSADEMGEIPDRYEGEDDAVAERVRWFEEPRAFPGDTIDQEAVRRAATDAMDQDVALARSPVALDAIPIAPSTRWRFVGPGNFAGRVTAIAVDPRNSARLFVCTSSGGAWRSTNGGTTWQEMTNGIGTNFTGAVTVDPNNSARIYLGTGDKDIWRGGTGLFVSTNGGLGFAATGLTAVTWIADIHVRRGDWRIVVVATDRGIERSEDGAASFTRTLNGAVDDLEVNPSNQNEMWVGVRGQGVFHSTDGGRTWLRDAGPSPTDDEGGTVGFGRVRLALCDGSPNDIYASFAVGDSAQIWRRRAAGLTWSKLPDTPQAGWGQLWYNHYVAVHPRNPQIVYSGQGTIYRSDFGGGRIWGFSTWREIATGGGDGFVTIHVDHHCMTFDPRNPDTVYAGCDGGVYRSTVGGPSWTYIGASIPSSEFYALGVGSDEHYQVGGGTQDNGTWTTDGAVNRWVHALGGDGFDFIVDPARPNRVYAETQNLRIYRSDNKGRPGTFAGKTNGIHPGDVRPWFAKLALSPTFPQQLFVGSDRVYRTRNHADSWQMMSCGRFVSAVSDQSSNSGASPPVVSRILIETTSTAAAALGIANVDRQVGDGGFARVVTSSEPFALSNGTTLDVRVDGGARQRVVFRTADFADIATATAVEVASVIAAQTSGMTVGPSTSSGISALAVAPSTSAAVYAASAADLYRSTSSGSSWLRLGSGLPNRWISDIAISGDRWYRAALTVSGTGTPHVYWSADGGANWVARSSGLPDAPASTIVVDPDDELRWWVGTDVGVYATTNGGQTWRPYSTGLPQAVVTDLDLHRTTGLLRASTYGRGIWERQATDLRIFFRRLRTASSGDPDRRTFRRTSDALALVMDLGATQDLVDLGLTYDAMFQIVDPRTNQPVQTVWTRNQRFQFGTNWWISRGTNWGPSSGWTTPAGWGIGAGLWWFRAAVLVNGADAFATVDDQVFEVVG